VEGSIDCKTAEKAEKIVILPKFYTEQLQQAALELLAGG
jgi:hypothetical protein